MTPIQVACQQGYHECLNVLISYGARFSMHRKGEISPYFYAIENDKPECVQILVDNHADITTLDCQGNTPLMKAIQEKCSDIFDILVQQRQNLNIMNHDGQTAIYNAVKSGNEHFVSRLIEAGANLQQTYEERKTLCHIAAHAKTAPVLQILIDNELDANQEDENGDTPLLIAVNEDYNEQVIALLLRYGCDPAHTNKRGRNAFATDKSENIQVITQVMEEEEATENRKKLQEIKNEQEKEEMQKRIQEREDKRNQLFQASIKKSTTVKLSKERRTLLAAMTKQGGTLRSKKSVQKQGKQNSAQEKPKEARPWGDSKENEQFQREVRCQLRTMRSEVQKVLDDLKQQVKELSNLVFGPCDDDSNEDKFQGNYQSQYNEDPEEQNYEQSEQSYENTEQTNDNSYSQSSPQQQQAVEQNDLPIETQQEIPNESPEEEDINQLLDGIEEEESVLSNEEINFSD